MDDLISRKTALDAFGLSEKTKKYGGDHSGYDTRMLYEIQDTLENLPAVQPETATVTIGRTKGSVTMWYECDACGEPIDQKDCYCKNCGRKLKYE